MNAQLLLLLALVGPFCAFTHASPTGHPTDLDVGITGTVAAITRDATEDPIQDLTVVTGPPATEPAAAPEKVTTEVVTEATLPFVTVNTEEVVVKTEAPVAATTTVAPEPLITHTPAVETTAPTEKVETEVIPEAKGAPEADTGEDVVIEDNTEEGLGSGQVVGIVIGALLAVVIVMAVVIAVVRRMGKYSP
ncbi:podoplanin isoform X2 [Siniperca chuatsi]|uniref:podoplanin isoform X2 n=1 Tax=Siniperca chuatsi TaxID=119488 RepID=UPI001CE0EE86|nr:podoplanin isoform X2 [Siniperca chuatsi]